MESKGKQRKITREKGSFHQKKDNWSLRKEKSFSHTKRYLRQKKLVLLCSFVRTLQNRSFFIFSCVLYTRQCLNEKEHTRTTLGFMEMVGSGRKHKQRYIVYWISDLTPLFPFHQLVLLLPLLPLQTPSLLRCAYEV